MVTVRRWESGTQYDYGTIVVYDSVQYKIIQPHCSQESWTPPATPALWARLADFDDQPWGSEKGPRPPPNYGQQQQSYEAPPAPPILEKETPPLQEQEPVVQPTHEERKKNWWDLDDNRKKELEIGGGLLAGIAALGAGYHAYKSHEKGAEEKKAHLWSLNNWIQEAEARTKQFRLGDYNGPVAWVLAEGKDIPSDAVEGGHEHGRPLYICRAYHDGGLMIGKASTVFQKGAVIGYKREEIHLSKYEILAGDTRAVRWINVSGNLHVRSLGYTPVEGGREPDGTPIYIAQAPYHGAVHPGKASEAYGDGAFVPYGSTEKKVKEYAVLCYA